LTVEGEDDNDDGKQLVGREGFRRRAAHFSKSTKQVSDSDTSLSSVEMPEDYSYAWRCVGKVKSELDKVNRSLHKLQRVSPLLQMHNVKFKYNKTLKKNRAYTPTLYNEIDFGMIHGQNVRLEGSKVLPGHIREVYKTLPPLKYPRMLARSILEENQNTFDYQRLQSILPSTRPLLFLLKLESGAVVGAYTANLEIVDESKEATDDRSNEWFILNQVANLSKSYLFTLFDGRRVNCRKFLPKMKSDRVPPKFFERAFDFTVKLGNDFVFNTNAHSFESIIGQRFQPSQSCKSLKLYKEHREVLKLRDNYVAMYEIWTFDLDRQFSEMFEDNMILNVRRMMKMLLFEKFARKRLKKRNPMLAKGMGPISFTDLNEFAKHLSKVQHNTSSKRLLGEEGGSFGSQEDIISRITSSLTGSTENAHKDHPLYESKPTQDPKTEDGFQPVQFKEYDSSICTESGDEHGDGSEQDRDEVKNSVTKGDEVYVEEHHDDTDEHKHSEGEDQNWIPNDMQSQDDEFDLESDDGSVDGITEPIRREFEEFSEDEFHEVDSESSA